MKLIYHLTIWFLGLTISTVRAQLLYSDPSIDDGACSKPAPVPLLNANLWLYDPLVTYYIPVASKKFYRFEYQMATNQPAQSEANVTSLQTKIQLLQLDAILNIADITVTFFGNPNIKYYYRGIPDVSLFLLINPLFDLDATTVHGSSGTGPSGFGGEINFTGIWNDDSPAWTVYTCIGGRQAFHIISGAPQLTDAQLEANKELLSGLGFNTTNFQYLNY